MRRVPVISLLLFAALTWAQQPAQQPASDHHHDAVMQRGEKGMGFSQTATTHHFLANDNGGVIKVEAKDPSDTKSRDQVRAHLQHIAHAFAAGDFAIPMFVHDQTVPGVAAMQRLKSEIRYGYEELPAGAQVQIRSSNPEAVAAIHDFLSFQIQDHRTGDPLPKREH